jgi:hypothetical protein
MAKWDELGDKFRDDLKRARTDKARSVQEHQVVENKGPDLWEKFKGSLIKAVEAINQTDRLLVLDHDPITRPDIRVVYNREGQHRSLTASFNHKTHKMRVITSVPGRHDVTREVVVVASEDGSVTFSDDARNIEEFVADLLRQLL